MYSFKICGIGILMSLYLFQGFHSDARTRLAVTASGNGIGTMAFEMNGATRNMVDEGSALGTLRLRYEKSSGAFDFSTGSNLSAVLSNLLSKWRMRKISCVRIPSISNSVM